jgi:hypothetical protein
MDTLPDTGIRTVAISADKSEKTRVKIVQKAGHTFTFRLDKTEDEWAEHLQETTISLSERCELEVRLMRLCRRTCDFVDRLIVWFRSAAVVKVD